MGQESSRREFLSGSALATAGLVASRAAADTGTEQSQPDHGSAKSFPREHAGAGGPVGSPTDRGKLVPGNRSPAAPPVLVETPDLPKLEAKLVDGVKEFHLFAQPVKRELLPGDFINHWGFNGSMPGPTIEVTEGDKLRFVLHNELPEPTTLHLHGLELANAMDGIEFLTQEPIMLGPDPRL